MYYPPPEKGTNWAAVIAGLAALGVGSYLIYWMWENGYFGCSRDDQCPAGYRCSKGKCVQSTDCTTSADCPPGYSCIKNKCVTAGCNSNADCPTGMFCVNHVCVDCRYPSDCPTGYTCQNGYCIPEAPDIMDCISGTAMSYYEGVQQGPIQGCTVRFTNNATHAVFTAISNADGYWKINNVPLGVYAVHAEAAHHIDNDYPYIPLTEAYMYRGGPGPYPDGCWPVPAVTNMIWLPHFNLNWSKGTGDPAFELFFDINPPSTMNHIYGEIIVSQCDLQHTRFVRICLIDQYDDEKQIWEAGWGGVGGGPQTLVVDKNFTERKVKRVRIYGSCISLFWEFPPIEEVDLVIEEKEL